MIIPDRKKIMSFRICHGRSALQSSPLRGLDLLAGYINYFSGAVVRTVVQNMRDQLEVKTESESEKPAQDGIKHRNQFDAQIRYLRYSLEIASVSGIVKPLYSDGQTVKDVPECG